MDDHIVIQSLRSIHPQSTIRHPWLHKMSPSISKMLHRQHHRLLSKQSTSNGNVIWSRRPKPDPRTFFVLWLLHLANLVINESRRRKQVDERAGMAQVRRHPLNAQTNMVKQPGHRARADMTRPRHEAEPEVTKLKEPQPQAGVPLVLLLEPQQESGTLLPEHLQLETWDSKKPGRLRPEHRHVQPSRHIEWHGEQREDLEIPLSLANKLSARHPRTNVVRAQCRRNPTGEGVKGRHARLRRR
jgi:hypothetical protein